MKLALISAGMFLASYLAVNHGLGPDPLSLVVPLLVVVGTALLSAKFMARRRPGRTKAAADIFDPPEIPLPPQPMSSPLRTGSKARKLF